MTAPMELTGYCTGFTLHFGHDLFPSFPNSDGLMSSVSNVPCCNILLLTGLPQVLHCTACSFVPGLSQPRPYHSRAIPCVWVEADEYERMPWDDVSNNSGSIAASLSELFYEVEATSYVGFEVKIKEYSSIQIALS